MDVISRECDTVFFPGCTLSATRAATTEKTYAYLREHLPDLGIVLDCCAKPARDLGRDGEFKERFAKLVNRLKDKGVKRIITACPSCHVTFKEYDSGLVSEMVYQTLAHYLPDVQLHEEIKYSVHDACATRFEAEVHSSVRTLAGSSGVELFEMTHSRQRAICCGEGGAALFVAPELAGKWQDIRGREMNGSKVITYCAGCSSTFGNTLANTHLLDLLFFPELSNKGNEKISKAPFTYINRLRLKKRLTAEYINDAKERRKPTSTYVVRSCLLLGLVLSIFGLRIAGIDDYLHSANLDQIIEACQDISPMVFIGLLALAPVLFLPIFPLVIIAGVLFGQNWGLIFSIGGASLGASFAFLLSRYLASDWLLRKISGSRADQLHQLVKDQGWKVVIVLRLIPLFPFAPLNYGLGLTGIRFTHYLAATIIGIVPACTGLVFFSSSLRQLFIDGSVVPAVIWSAFLFVIASLCAAGRKILPAKINKT